MSQAISYFVFLAFAPRVIGITRYEASVPAPSLAAERIHINALRAYGSYRFHGLGDTARRQFIACRVFRNSIAPS